MSDKFNSDLLRNEDDHVFLRSQFPLIAEAVTWDELGETFDQHEDEAVQDKVASGRRINLGIALVVASLLVTLLATAPVAQPLLTARPWLASSVGLLALLLLGTGLLFGRGVISGHRRDDWLRHRMIAERLRQFHFQFLAANLELVCRRDMEAERKLADRKKRGLAAIMQKVAQRSYLQAVVDDDDLSKALMVDIPVPNVDQIDHECWQQFLRYYEILRLDWQEQYARSFFTEGASPFRKRGTTKDRERAAGIVETFSVTVIILLQAIAVLIQLFDPANLAMAQLCVLGSSAAAILIVGVHAIRDSGALGAELTRYRHYISHIANSRRTFDCDTRPDDVSDIAAAIRHMEEAAYFEMREFILTRKRVELSI